MPKYSTPTFDVNVDPDGFVLDVNSLYDCLTRLHDSRHARGTRYALVTVLLYVVLAKLAGENHLAGIAEWVALRQDLLAEALHLHTPRAPHLSTYSRLLGHVIDVNEFEQVVHDFFAAQPGAGESVTIALDGKTRRGTIPAGRSHGVHLLAAYLTGEGWVLLQLEVGSKENEIRAAPRLLKTLDLWQHPCHLGTGENHDRGCLARPARPVGADCGGGGRLRLDGERESTGTGARPGDPLRPGTRGERIQPRLARRL